MQIWSIKFWQAPDCISGWSWGCAALTVRRYGKVLSAAACGILVFWRKTGEIISQQQNLPSFKSRLVYTLQTGRKASVHRLWLLFCLWGGVSNRGIKHSWSSALQISRTIDISRKKGFFFLFRVENSPAIKS